MTAIIGNTYLIKDQLKRLGAKWDGDQKAWLVPDTRADEARALLTAVQNSSLKENALLIRLSLGMPGEQRQDVNLTAEVKASHSLGTWAGKWEKFLFPPEALKPIKELDAKARAYHNAVTLPFDNGVGILPAVLIPEYGDKMRGFAGQRAHLVASHFLAKYQDWIDWAKVNHNETFDASLYPPVEEIKEKFYFRTEPLPIPDGAHFANTVASLLGTDVDSVNQRVAAAASDAQKELLRRMIEPVAHMAKKLSEDSPRIFDTLITNIEDIVRLAPALNLNGDPKIDAFVADMKGLTHYHTEHLRGSKSVRDGAQKKAAAVLQKLSGYAL